MRCSVCGQDKDPDAFDKRKKFPTCKACIQDALKTGKKIQIFPDKPSEVKTIADLRDYTVWRMGIKASLPAARWKASTIIFKECGYPIPFLAELANWCAENSKHPDEPWKIIFWAEQYSEDKLRRVAVNAIDPVQKKLDELYASSSDAIRKRIMQVSGKTDKREALALLRELN